MPASPGCAWPEPRLGYGRHGEPLRGRGRARARSRRPARAGLALGRCRDVPRRLGRGTPRSSSPSPSSLAAPVRVLRVKGSGSDLKSVTRRDFPGVRLPEVLALLERPDMGDQEMVDYLARCLQEPGSPRPSIETLLHGFLDGGGRHSYARRRDRRPDEQRARPEVVEDLFGKETMWCPIDAPASGCRGRSGRPSGRGRRRGPSSSRSTGSARGARRSRTRTSRRSTW